MLRRPMTRGCLFVLEGLDRCGKSTQAALLSQRPNTDSIRFPDRTSPTGQLINACGASG
jgi:dTMP kinase